MSYCTAILRDSLCFFPVYRLRSFDLQAICHETAEDVRRARQKGKQQAAKAAEEACENVKQHIEAETAVKPTRAAKGVAPAACMRNNFEKYLLNNVGSKPNS